jgi:hypothetical protein
MKTQNFTDNQVKWASLHDWFISGDNQSITVRNVFWNAAGKVEVSTGFFENFKDLRDWAGY